jgi:predicted transcriptional regulator
VAGQDASDLKQEEQMSITKYYRQRISPTEIALMKKMYTEDNKTIRQIAAELDRSYGAVQKYLHQEKVALRPKGGQKR